MSDDQQVLGYMRDSESHAQKACGYFFFPSLRESVHWALKKQTDMFLSS